MKYPLGRSSCPAVAHRLGPADVDPDRKLIRFRSVFAATINGFVDAISVILISSLSDEKKMSTKPRVCAQPTITSETTSFKKTRDYQTLSFRGKLI